MSSWRTAGLKSEGWYLHSTCWSGASPSFALTRFSMSPDAICNTSHHHSFTATPGLPSKQGPLAWSASGTRAPMPARTSALHYDAPACTLLHKLNCTQLSCITLPQADKPGGTQQRGGWGGGGGEGGAACSCTCMLASGDMHVPHAYWMSPGCMWQQC